MNDQRTRTERFRALHEGPEPLLIPNAWDAGSAAILASLGFAAIATTSAGHAATLGRLDGAVTREEAIAHAALLVSASGLPVSADLENCFADEPGGVGETIELAIGAGLSGCSIEDWDGDSIYPFELAVERVAAAADAAHRGADQLVLTARAENHIRGRDDLDDTIARLQAFEAAGADVLYAPGLIELDDIKRVVESVGRPVNVLARPGVAVGRRARRRRRAPHLRRRRRSRSRRSARWSRRPTSCARAEPTASSAAPPQAARRRAPRSAREGPRGRGAAPRGAWRAAGEDRAGRLSRPRMSRSPCSASTFCAGSTRCWPRSRRCASRSACSPASSRSSTAFPRTWSSAAGRAPTTSASRSGCSP